MSPINANVDEEQISVSVSGDGDVSATVSGGIGPSGPTGTAGTAATITVGTVTTGAPGSSASVVNAGTTSAAVLDFTIPAGAAGATGATGPAGTTTWTGITNRPTTVAGFGITDAVITSDSRLSDARTPTAHATSHAASGSDAILPEDIGAAYAIHGHGYITFDGQITGASSGQVVVTTTNGAITSASSLAWSLISSTPTTISGYGITDAAASTHSHGNISSAGLVAGNTASGRIVTTTTGGSLTTSETISSSAVSGLAAVATSGSYADLTNKPSIPSAYTLPNATTSTLGGVIVGTGLSVSSGTVSVTTPVSYATAAQAQASTSSSTIITPQRFRDAFLSWRQVTLQGGSTASGGSFNLWNNWQAFGLITTTTTNGTVVARANTPSDGYMLLTLNGNQNNAAAKDWTLTHAFQIRVWRQTGNTNTVIRVQLGEKSTNTAFAQMTGRGIGFELRNRRVWLLAHNGTTLTQTDTGIDAPTDQSPPSEFIVWTDGSGTVSLSHESNGTVSTATSTGGPTSKGSNNTLITAEATNGADATAITYYLTQPIVMTR